MERQISTLYYERLLASRNQELVKAEAEELTTPLAAQNFIKAPCVLGFLDLKNYPALRESDLERTLLDKLQEFFSVLNDAQQVFASRYRLTLPSSEELQHETEAERKRIEEQEG